MFPVCMCVDLQRKLISTVEAPVAILRVSKRGWETGWLAS